MPSSSASRAERTAAIALGVSAVLVVLYLPVAVSATWYAFTPGAPHLLDGLNSALSGHRYATGPGSVSAVRGIDYAEHRWTMLVHTTLGAVSLGLALALTATARRRRWVAHRRLGRLFWWTVAGSMSAAIVFLLLAPPEHFVGARAFRLQLWELAAGTLGAAHFARRAGRRRDVRSHRWWALLTFAFLLTAPLLRLLWTVLGPVFPAHDMLTNLEVGSVLLAVVAPAGAGTAYLATQQPSPAPHTRPAPPRAACAVLTMLGATGLALIVRAYAELPGAAAASAYPWFAVAPVAAWILLCQTMARRARRREGATERQWLTLLAGVALSPWSVLLVDAAGRHWLGPVDGYLAALMVAPGVPITAAMATLVSAAAARESPRPAPAPGPRARR